MIYVPAYVCVYNLYNMYAYIYMYVSASILESLEGFHRLLQKANRGFEGAYEAFASRFVTDF